jgi:hypothetical protein
LDLPYDNPNNYFASFVSRLVAFYSSRGIHHWIIWNEPDIRPGEGPLAFEGEVEDYALLLKSGYLEATAVDPQAHIQIAGLSWWYDSEHGREPYLQRLLRTISADPEAAQHGSYFDGISLHIYFTSSSVWTILNANHQILNQFGLGHKEVWLNEFNASPRRDPVTPIAAPFNLSLEQQADFIVQASALALAAGVDRLAIYKLYDTDFIAGQTEAWGLVRSDGSLRPGFLAYQQVINRFSNAGTVRRYSSDAATLVSLQYSDRTLYVLWNDTFNAGQFLIYVNDAQEISINDAVGNEWTAATESIDGANVLMLDAPPAERIDMDWVVVAGAVRIVNLAGGLRSVAFRTAQGSLIRLN